MKYKLKVALLCLATTSIQSMHIEEASDSSEECTDESQIDTITTEINGLLAHSEFGSIQSAEDLTKLLNSQTTTDAKFEKAQQYTTWHSKICELRSRRNPHVHARIAQVHEELQACIQDLKEFDSGNNSSDQELEGMPVDRPFLTGMIEGLEQRLQELHSLITTPNTPGSAYRKARSITGSK